MKIFILILFSTPALIIFTLFSMEIFEISFKKMDFEITVRFDDIQTVQKRAPLIYQSIKIGEVETVDFKYENQKQHFVETKIKIDNKYRDIIRKNSNVYIVRRKFIGSAFLLIEPNWDNPVIETGDYLISQPYPTLISLGVKIKNILSHSKNMILVAKSLKFIKKLKETYQNTTTLLNDIEPDIKKLINNSVIFQKELNNLTENIKLIDLKESKKLLSTLKKRSLIPNVDSQIENGENLLDNFIVVRNILSKKTPKILNSIENIEKSIANIKNNIDLAKSYIFDGFGTIGLFLNDPETYDYRRIFIKVIKKEGYRYIIPTDIPE